MIEVNLDYIDYVNIPITKKSLIELSIETLKKSKHSKDLDGKKVYLDIAIVSEAEMKRVNNTYRGNNSSTDVISIGEYSDEKNIINEKSNEIVLGEILLCWSDIKKNATIQHTDMIYEFAYVYTHGILHLLGYQHSEEMFSVQEEVSIEFYEKIIQKNEIS